MAPASPLLHLQGDRRLARLAADGSQRAFEVLVERHRSELAASCRRIAGPGAAAEDAVQQALLSAWVALQGGAVVLEPRAWMHRIARNAALDVRRRACAEPGELPDTLPAAALTEALVERRLTLSGALEQIAALPDHQREALVRTALDGTSYDEVAADLGTSGAAVRGMVARARTSLRAAAAALLPFPLLRPGGPSGERRGTLLERLAELLPAAPAGAVAIVAKGGAAVVVTGAVAVGVAPRVDGADGERGGGEAAASSVRDDRATAGAPITGLAAAVLARAAAAPSGEQRGGRGRAGAPAGAAPRVVRSADGTITSAGRSGGEPARFGAGGDRGAAAGGDDSEPSGRAQASGGDVPVDRSAESTPGATGATGGSDVDDDEDGEDREDGREDDDDDRDRNDDDGDRDDDGDGEASGSSGPGPGRDDDDSSGSGSGGSDQSDDGDRGAPDDDAPDLPEPDDDDAPELDDDPREAGERGDLPQPGD